jgi:hypothetical protein
VTASTSNVVSLHLAEDLELARVTPGKYSACYVGHRALTVFRTAKLRIDFQLLEHPGITLPRWYRIQDYTGGRIRCGRHGDAVRELSAVIGRRLRHDRLQVSVLQDLLLHVLVRDVARDGAQSPLADVNKYSIIERLLGVYG